MVSFSVCKIAWKKQFDVMARIVIKSRDSIYRAQAFATTWMSDCSNCRVI
jgi:hypothetical protein